ncbi:MAG: GGDEF domain-containing protein, partial [bacterium]|nr:GGDEF domain-containing protein [bacterium]
LREMALVCPLTNVGNRRFLEDRLQATYAEFQRNGWPFGILMLDLDHFKQVNDTHGHQAGDEVLKTVAKTLMAGLRPYDHLGRWGGEEFMVVLPNATDVALRSVGERCRMLVERSNAVWQKETIRVTVSIGGAAAGLEDTVTTLVERADENLYQSKENGRNRVIV